MKNDNKCTELLNELKAQWDGLWEGKQSQLLTLMVKEECKEVIPYLLLHLQSEDPYYRQQAIRGLGTLQSRENRGSLIDVFLNDPDENVKITALINLQDLFKGERDVGILSLALTAFDDPRSSVGIRLCAGATMMYQLEIPEDELGGPGWWNEEEEDLQHPSIQRAVEETRNLLKSEGM